MAVERAADALAGAHFVQHRLDHLAVRVPPRFTLAVERLQAAYVRMHPRKPQLDDAVRRAGEHDVGLLDAGPTQWRDVRAERHADADAHEASPGTH
jgi:hypothetical protein